MLKARAGSSQGQGWGSEQAAGWQQAAAKYRKA